MLSEKYVKKNWTKKETIVKFIVLKRVETGLDSMDRTGSKILRLMLKC